MVFHYALEAFEGMKAYLDDNRIIRLFRPEMNMERLNSSAKRLALPVSEKSTQEAAELTRAKHVFSE